MNTRCKFKCTGKIETDQSEGANFNYEFQPVYSEDPESENAMFWKYSPSGKLELGCTSEKDFTVGKEYYIDISLAE